ncbi:MAG: protein-disulfide reductase DsbD domain-containing protein, partial [Verrucomicrobiota bacterium]
MSNLCGSMSFLRRLFPWVVLLSFALPLGAQVKVSLVAPVTAVRPGETFEAALRVEHAPTWHTYWINAGSGYATSLDWTLPEGWSAGAIKWPVPMVIHDYRGVVTGQGYEGVELLPVKITVPADAAIGSTVTLKAAADWLMCDPKQCVPGNAEVQLALTVTDGDPEPSAQAGDFTGIARPQAPPEGVSVRVERAGAEGGGVRLRIAGAEAAGLAEPHFFTENDFVAFDAKQTVAVDGEGALVLTLAVSPAADPADQRLRGVLAFGEKGGRSGWSLDEPVVVVADGPEFAVTRA